MKDLRKSAWNQQLATLAREQGKSGAEVGGGGAGRERHESEYAGMVVGGWSTEGTDHEGCRIDSSAESADAACIGVVADREVGETKRGPG